MIALVGCGFLGSLFAEELSKRLMAFELGGTIIKLIDSDTFEQRNAANQNCRLIHANEPKAEVMAQLVSEYGLAARHAVVRVTEDNINAVLEGVTFVVDAVDNLETRHLLWRWCKGHDIPLMHLGISQAGTGCVDWTYKEFDSWSLSPIALAAQGGAAPAGPVEALPPCELVAFRGLGFNTALCGAKAYGIWQGLDAENEVGNDLEAGLMTVWQTENKSHRLLEQFTVAIDNDVLYVGDGQLPLVEDEDEDEENDVDAEWPDQDDDE